MPPDGAGKADGVVPEAVPKEEDKGRDTAPQPVAKATTAGEGASTEQPPPNLQTLHNIVAITRSQNPQEPHDQD